MITPNSRHFSPFFMGLLMTLALLTLSGCSKMKIIPIANQEVVALKANEICQLMRRAGFNNEQIIELGADLRNSLASGGAAQIRIGSRTEAIYAVHLPYIHVSTRQRGTFIYDCEKCQIQ